MCQEQHTQGPAACVASFESVAPASLSADNLQTCAVGFLDSGQLPRSWLGVAGAEQHGLALAPCPVLNTPW